MSELDLDALLVHRLSDDRWGWDSVWLETEGGAALDDLIQRLREAEAQIERMEMVIEAAHTRIVQLERVREVAEAAINDRDVAWQRWAVFDQLRAALAAVEEPARK